DFCIDYRAIAEPVLAAIGQHPRTASPLIVAVCGRSRSGKTIVAHAVARSLADAGTAALHVRLDDWIMPAADRRPGDDAEMRSRIDLLPGIVDSLRDGRAVTAPGYDARTRKTGQSTIYDPKGCQVIILDGLFAAHPSIRERVDLAVFVEPPSAAQAKARFVELYRWKGFSDDAIEDHWPLRSEDEWPKIDAQRQNADLIVAATAKR
ncbi:MAG: histidinol phosphate phosphatase, partial [Pseudolabrys sp.]|nr:histidinol phosphate phosphatase [Pseudolabrys sp.]